MSLFRGFCIRAVLVLIGATNGASAEERPVLREQAGAARHRVACRIGAKDLLGQPRSGVLVDVRRGESPVWVPGTLQLGVSELADSPAIQPQKRVVLLGDGKDTASLLRQCAALRSRGLSQLQVLDGGVPAWHRAGGTVVGDVASLERPLQLASHEVHSILQDGSAAVIFAGESPTSAWAKSSNRLVQARAAETPAVVLRRIARGSAPIVIVLPDGGDPAPWRNAARASALDDPLFFIGEASRYDAYRHEQANIAAHANAPPSSLCEQ